MKLTIEDINKIHHNGTVFTNETAQELLSIVKVKHLKKRETFVKEGEICSHWGYIDKGLIRAYYYKHHTRKREVTEDFYMEGCYFTAIESYFHRTPSHLILEALEPTTIYTFHYDEFESLCERNHEMEHDFRKGLEHILLEAQTRLDSLLFETAQERYDGLLKNIPELILRVPSIYISSYLGVTPETLSRIRAKSGK